VDCFDTALAIGLGPIRFGEPVQQREVAISADISLARGLTLQPMTDELARLLGPAVANIEPWSQINYPASNLIAFLSADDPALSRYTVLIGSEPAGVIAIRSPWLHGPYLQLLAVLPPFQNQGFGTILLDWFETRANPRNRWLWLCYSSFNKRAGAFYARHGFEVVAALTELMSDGGDDEILMRKRVNRLK
jgi:diamine N-acetyltransferase